MLDKLKSIWLFWESCIRFFVDKIVIKNINRFFRIIGFKCSIYAQYPFYRVYPSFEFIEAMSEFPGGKKKLLKYLSMNIRYPIEARKNLVSGKVFCSFVVEKDGEITDAKIISGIGFGCEEEVIRVILEMPKWKPGHQNFNPVRVRMNLPVTFKLDSKFEKSPTKN